MGDTGEGLHGVCGGELRGGWELEELWNCWVQAGGHAPSPAREAPGNQSWKSNFLAIIHLGILLLSANRDDEGIAILKGVLDVHPGKALAHQSLAKIYRQKDMQKEALGRTLTNLRGKCSNETPDPRKQDSSIPATEQGEPYPDQPACPGRTQPGRRSVYPVM